MKKYFLMTLLIGGSLILVYCNPGKKATATSAVEKSKTTYANSVSTVIMNNCVPCHVPSKGGNKKAFDNFANVKTDIDEMIRRVELNPGDKGYMPFKRPKLNDSTIAVFKQWKADGMLEN